MAKQFFENTTRTPSQYFGVTLQPGEGKWIEVGDTNVPGPSATMIYDPATGKVSAGGQDLFNVQALAAGSVTGAGFSVPDAQLVSNWSISGAVTGTITNGTDAALGQVLNINATTAGTRLSARREFGQSVKQFAGLSLYLKKDANLSVVDIELFVGDYSVAKRTALNKAVGNLDAGAWQRVAIPLSEWENAYLINAADTSFLTGIRIGATPIGGQTTVLQVAGIQLHDVPAGTVSFFFDDARLDTYTEAYRILKQYSYAAAVAPEYTRLGTSPSYSLMTEAQVDDLYFNGGWDICGHHYFNMTAQSEATAVGIHQACKAWMRTRGYTRGDHIWAWPGGARDAASQAIANRYWQVTRRVGSFTYAGIPGTFDPGAPPNWYVSSGQNAAQVLALVDKVKGYGGSLVLTFHSLVNNKVAPEDFLISDFAALVQGIASRGVPVVPPSKVWTKQ